MYQRTWRTTIRKRLLHLIRKNNLYLATGKGWGPGELEYDVRVILEELEEIANQLR